MDPFWSWFAGEAGAAWIVGIFGIVFGLYSFYKTRKPVRGRHVVCTQTTPSFSHLRLSQSARQWLRVEYVGEDQEHPSQIESLSQTLIEIQLASDTDALNEIELTFSVPEARVLGIWWQEAPEYLVEESELGFHLIEDSSDKKQGNPGSQWEIKVSLPQLKSYDKYKEKAIFGILADGDLESITLPPQGSKGSVSQDQVWTANYIPCEVFEAERLKSEIRKQSLRLLFWTALLSIAVAAFLWITDRLFGSFVADLRLFVAAFFAGLMLAGILGYYLQEVRLATYVMGRAQNSL